MSRREDKEEKDGKFEALDFVLGVLREDVTNLGRIVGDLEKIADVIGKPNGMGGRLDAIETQLASTRAEIANLISSLDREPGIKPVSAKPAVLRESIGTPVIVSCRVWEDFRTLARQADQAAFTPLQEDTFEIGAQKGNRIYKYVGKLPPYSTVIRAWLAKELDVADPNIIEGDLTLR